MEKKKRIFVFSVASLSILLLLIAGFIFLKDIPVFSFSESNNITFYEKAVNYIRENNDDSYCKNEEDYQLFTEYRGFGSYSDKNYTYVFLWISEESYYTKNGKLYSGSGSNMPYKFIFKDGNLINYEIPMDGAEYISSIRKWFPKPLKFLSNIFINNIQFDDENISRQIKEHYSYLKSTEINYGAVKKQRE